MNNLKVTHIGRVPQIADHLGRYVSGVVMAQVAGNRVTLFRQDYRGNPVIVSDESIPDSHLDLVMADLVPVDSDEAKEILANTATGN